jgi:type III secretory pathway lipoprotein EscJ
LVDFIPCPHKEQATAAFSISEELNMINNVDGVLKSLAPKSLKK